MKYSIKQMSVLLGTTTHKLRYYQKLGIIHPTVDEKTGYRYFSVLDTRRFNLACRYTDLGFSLNEILNILNKYNEQKFINKIKQQKEIIKKEVIIKKLSLEIIDDIEFHISNIKNYLNKITIFEFEEMARIEFSNGEILNERDILKIRDELLNYSPLIEYVSRIPKETLKENKELNYHYGINIKKTYLKQLEIKEDLFRTIEKGKYLYTIFKKTNRLPFDWSSLKYLKEYIEKNKLEYEDAYSSCIYSSLDNEDYLNYHYIIMKIK